MYVWKNTPTSGSCHDPKKTDEITKDWKLEVPAARTASAKARCLKEAQKRKRPKKDLLEEASETVKKIEPLKSLEEEHCVVALLGTTRSLKGIEEENLLGYSSMGYENSKRTKNRLKRFISVLRRFYKHSKKKLSWRLFTILRSF
ncbi:hypothetical protein QR680_002764 [Steinernema hermaphroditum]|uniref:Uncharacterized protein n=1 Tax=Steinernema hermaphroditum TaxID=289476 RepID=A0AA39LIC1_9BILA|nr:hypothetical protein QR680_002764 [Steinernema hermaphroditum]